MVWKHEAVILHIDTAISEDLLKKNALMYAEDLRGVTCSSQPILVWRP